MRYINLHLHYITLLRVTEVVSGDNWSYKTCKAPVKSSPSTNQHTAFYRPDALPVAQPTVSDNKMKTIKDDRPTERVSM